MYNNQQASNLHLLMISNFTTTVYFIRLFKIPTLLILITTISKGNQFLFALKNKEESSFQVL